MIHLASLDYDVETQNIPDYAWDPLMGIRAEYRHRFDPEIPDFRHWLRQQTGGAFTLDFYCVKISAYFPGGHSIERLVDGGVLANNLPWDTAVNLALEMESLAHGHGQITAPLADDAPEYMCHLRGAYPLYHAVGAEQADDALANLWK